MSADAPVTAKVLEAARETLTSFAIMVTCECPPLFTAYAMHRLIADWLMRVEAGICKRLGVYAPPQHGKTRTLSLFIAWYLGRHPERRVMFVTYAESYAAEVGDEIRKIMISAAYRAIFPSAEIRADKKAKTSFELTAGGKFFAAGIDGQITGRGADLIVLDDVTKNQADADSPAHRATVRRAYYSDVLTRLADEGAIVFIQTRRHEEDLAGILDEAERSGGDKWEKLILRAIAEGDDPLGREPGEAVCPGRFKIETLEARKKNTPTREWEALYQQRTAPPGGTVFLREWFIEHAYAGLPTDLKPSRLRWDRVIVYLDAKLKETQGPKASFAALVVVARDGRNSYLIDVRRAQCGTIATVDMVDGAVQSWPVDTIVIESAAAGPGVKELLVQKYAETGVMREVTSAVEPPGAVHLPMRDWTLILACGHTTKVKVPTGNDPPVEHGCKRCVPRVEEDPCTGRGSKHARADAASPAVREGTFRVPVEGNATWMPDYIHEMCAFGAGGAHNDQVDATAGSVHYLAGGSRLVSVRPGGMVGSGLSEVR